MSVYDQDKIDTWVSGVAYTHEHFSVDPRQFVGHVPAAAFHEAESYAIAIVPTLLLDIDQLREMIRRVVMDNGSLCDHPETCGCSYAALWRYSRAASTEASDAH